MKKLLCFFIGMFLLIGSASAQCIKLSPDTILANADGVFHHYTVTFPYAALNNDGQYALEYQFKYDGENIPEDSLSLYIRTDTSYIATNYTTSAITGAYIARSHGFFPSEPLVVNLNFSNISLNYFYGAYLSHTNEKIRFSIMWLRPGDYTIELKLIAMTGGDRNNQMIFKGKYMGGANAIPTGEVVLSTALVTTKILSDTTINICYNDLPYTQGDRLWTAPSDPESGWGAADNEGKRYWQQAVQFYTNETYNSNTCYNRLDSTQTIRVCLYPELTTSISESGHNTTICQQTSAGYAMIDIAGGKAPYSIQPIKNGQNYGEPIVVEQMGTNIRVGGLSKGGYTFAVTDANGCTAITGDITIAEAQQDNVISLTATPTHVTCYGGNNGSVSTSREVTTGVQAAPYIYEWSNQQSGEDVTSISGITAGNYSVTVTDNMGCTATASVTVSEAEAITSSKEVWCCTSQLPYHYDPNGPDTVFNAAGTKDIVYHAANGCDSVVSVTLTVYDPSVELSDITGTATICNGSSTELSVGAIADGTEGTVTFVWKAGNNVITTGIVNEESSSTITVSPTDTTTYTVEATATMGEGENACTATATKSFTVNVNAPAVVLDAISGTTTICSGDETELSISTATGTKGTVTYVWNTQETTSAITVNPDETTEYSVVATATVGEGNEACSVTASKSVEVTVNAPAVALSDIEPVTICKGGQGTTLAVGAIADGTNGELSYVWSAGEQAIENSNSASISVNPEATTTYSVVATATVGNCTTTATKSVTVTVNAPAVALSDIEPITICKGGEGTTLTVSAIADGTNGDLSYVWSAGNTAIENSNSASISVNPEATTTYSVVVTATVDDNDVPCTATATKSVTVTVNAPAVALSDIEPVTICKGGQGTTLTVSAISDGTNGDLSYVWSAGNTAIENSNSASISVNPEATTTYSVVVTATVNTNDVVCTATATKSVTVTVNAPAVALSDITGSSTICAGSNTTLSVVPTSNTGTVTYAWTAGEETIGGNNNSITVTPDATTEYTVVATATVNTNDVTCTATDTKSFEVTVNAPAVALGDIAGTTTICKGNETTLSVEPTSSTGTVTYAWSTQETGSSITVSPTQNTTYIVTATATVNANNVNCTVTDTKSVSVTVNAPAITMNAISGDTHFCLGGSTELTASTQTANGDVTYAWSPATYLNTTEGATVTSTPTAAGTIEYTATGTATVNTNSVTCTATATQSVTVTVNDTVQLSTEDATLLTQSVCAGSDITPVEISYANATITHSTIPAGMTYSDENNTITLAGAPTTAGEYTITLTAASDQQNPICSGKTLTFNLNVNPTVTLSATHLTQSVCAGSAIQDVEITNTNSTVTTSELPTGLQFYPEDYIITGAPTTAGTYEVVITATSDQSEPQCAAKKDTLKLTVNPTVTLSATNLTQSVCSGSAITNVVITNTNSTVTTSELPEGLTFSNNTIAGTPTTAGTYAITITATSNQSNPTCDPETATFNLTVNPTVTLSATNLTQSVCAGNAITNVVITNTNSTVTTSELPEGLTFSNNTIAGAPTTAGTYAITITATSNQSNPTCDPETATFNLTVNPTVTLEATNLTQTVCAGSTIANVVITNTNSTVTTSELPEGLTFSNNTIASAPTTAGTYAITITATSDQSNPTCEPVTATFNLTVNPTVTLSATNLTQSVCAGSAITDVVITNTNSTVTTSTLPDGLTFSNNTIAGTPTAAGEYTITITATSNQEPACTAETVTFDLTVKALPEPALSDAVICASASDINSTLTLTTDANMSNYTWSVDGGTITEGTGTNSIQVQWAAAGEKNISITYTGTNGCEGTNESSVTVYAAPEFTVTGNPANNSICAVEGTDVITVNSNTQYNYEWSAATGLDMVATEASNAKEFKSNTAGTYAVTIIGSETHDNLTCLTTQNVTVTVNAQPVLTVTPQNPTCYGGNNGKITTTVTGGTPAYTFDWSNDTHSNNAQNLTAGTYSVTVTDGNGCHAYATDITLTDPSQITATKSNHVDVDCHGASTGAFTVTASNGTAFDGGQYLYKLGDDQEGTLAVSKTFNNLPAGNYVVTVSDRNGCPVEIKDTIVEPAALSVTAISGAANYCLNDEAAELAVTISGGNLSGDYDYSWEMSIDNGETWTEEEGDDVYTPSTAEAGTFLYRVTVSDECPNEKTTESVTVVVYSLPTIGDIAEQTICVGTTTTLAPTISGGKADLTYAWYLDNSNEPIANATSATYTTPAEDATDGATHTYKLVVTDACGNTANKTFTVKVAQALAVADIENQTICVGTSTTLTAAPSNGTEPYTYQWYKGNAAIANATNASYETPAADAVSGQSVTYKVVVTDACEYTVAVEKTVTVSVVNALAVADIENQTICVGTSTTLTAVPSNGTEPYTYQWYKGDNAIANATNASYETPTTDAVSGQSVTYKVIVTDACENTVAVEKTVTVSVVNALTVADIENQTICVGTSATLTAVPSNGTTPYAYQWYKGNDAIEGATSASYETPTTDAVSGQSVTYKVIVTDACENTVAVEKTVTVSVVNALTVADIENQTICVGTSTTLTAVPSNGTTPYAYQWYKGNAEIEGANDATYTTPTSDAVSGQSVTYKVVVTDACANTVAVEKTVTVSVYDALDIEENHTNISCFGGDNGSITVTASNGNPGYQFKIDNESYSELSATTTATYDQLTAGNYTVTVKDNCGTEKSIAIELTEPAALAATITEQVNVNCYRGNDGSITVMATENTGTAPYTYKRKHVGEFSTDNTFSGLAAGKDTIVVMDNNGCSVEVPFEITQPDTLELHEIADSHIDVSCNGLSDGAIEVAATGGFGTYLYNWNNGGFGGNAADDQLEAGEYTIVVRDGHSCTASVTVTITEPDALNATIEGTNISCYGETDGTITVSVSGGTEPYTYRWNDDNQQNRVAARTNVSAGEYTVTVTDAHYCTSIKNITLTQPADFTVSVAGDNEICAYETTTFTATTTGDVTLKWYLNDNEIANETNAILSNVNTAGTYKVVATQSGSNCTKEATITLTVDTVPNVTITGESSICYNTQVTLTANNADSYVWGEGVDENTSVTNTLTADSTFVVTGTNSYGCTASASHTVTVNALPDVTMTFTLNNETVTPNNSEIDFCADGTLTLSVPDVEGSTYTWYGADELLEEDGHSLTLTNATPEQTGWYYVKVTNANGCENQSGSTLIVANPLPNVVLSEDHNLNTICADSAFHFTVTCEACTTAVSSYVWKLNDDIITGASTSTLRATEGGTYVVTATDENGCVNVTNTLPVTVNALPTVTLSEENNLTTICADSAFHFVATCQTEVSYSWQRNNGLMDGHNSTLRATEAGNYVVTVTDVNGCSNSSNTMTVIVNPVPNFTIGSESDDNEGNENGISVCFGTDVSLYAVQESEDELYDYTWQTNGYLDPNDGEATFIGTAPADTYTISATATNSFGCSQTQSHTIVVRSLPTITVADAQVCLNGTVALSASGADEYEWTPASYFMAPNTITDDVTGANVTFYGTEAGEKVITITGTDEYGCVNMTTATVTVLDLPTTGLTLANKEICQGASTSWTIENGNYTNYVWASSSEDALTADGATATFTSSTTGTHSVTVTVTDNNNCTNSSSAEVMVHALPTPALSSDNAVCEGNTITFTTDAANADNGIHDYIWTYPETNATVTGETDGNTLTLSWADNGSKTVTVNYTDGNGCTATQAASRSITVNALPDVVITNGQSAAICLGGTVNLNAVGATSYVWENEAGNTATITVEPKRDSTFTVTGTDDNGCSNTAAINITVYDTVKLTATNATQTLCLGTAIEPIALTTANCALDFGQMPTELTYDATSNTITGELSTAGVHSFTITATSEHGCSSKSVPVFITMNDTVKLAATNTTQTHCLGTAIEPIELTIANCELDFGQMPTSELTYDESDHVITGELSSAGEHTFTITASSTTCPSSEKSVVVSITMNDTARLVVTNTTQELCLGEPIADIVLDTAHCTLDFGQMPTGLTYNAGEHKIKGELENAGTYTFTITASNNCGNKTADVSITMMDTAKLTATNTTQTLCLGTPIRAIVLDTAHCTLNLTLPAGLSYNEADHQIEGEIHTAGAYNFTITANSDCGEKSVNISITMNDTVKLTATNPTQTHCLGEDITVIEVGAANCTLDFGQMPSVLTYSEEDNTISGRLEEAQEYTFTITATSTTCPASNKTLPVSITMNDTVKLVAISPAENFIQKFCKGETMNNLNFYVANYDDVELTGAPAGVTLEAVTATSATDPNYVMSGTPTQTGTFNFTITASSEACETSSKTFTGTIVVDTIPAVNITTDAVNNMVCAGETITLTATAGYEEYVWSNEEEDDIIEIEPDRTNYTVTVTNGEGCSNTAAIEITINTLPTVTLTEEHELDAICADSAFHFVAECESEVTYAWKYNNTLIEEAEESTLRATEAGKYVVNVTDGNGCSNVSDTLTVTVNALPEVTTEHENVSCTELGSATVIVTTGIGEYTCAWNGGTPEEMTIMADLPTLIINELSEGTYTYVVTDLNSCSTAGTVTIENPGFITGTQSILSNIVEEGICKGSDNIVSFTINGGTPDYTIEWVNAAANGNGEVVAETDEVSSTPATFNLNELAAGDYLLAMVITDVFGCTGIAADTIALTVWPTYNIVREINIGTGLNEYTYGEQTYAITNGIPEVPETEELETAHGCDSIISYVVNQYDLEILFADTCIMTRSNYTREYANTPNELLGDTIYLAKNTPSYFYAYLSNTTETTWNDERMDMSYELQYSEQTITEDDMPNLVENFSISTYYDRMGVYFGINNLTEPTGEIPSTTFAFRQTANSTIMQYDYFYFDAFKNIPNKVTFTGLENGTYTLKLKAELRNSVEETGTDRIGIYNPYIVKRKYGHILGGYGDTVGTKEVIAARNLTIIVNEDGMNPSGAPAAISEYSHEASVQSFPNPVNDQLNLVINGMEGNTQITITDAQGKVVRVINAELTGATEVLTYSVSNFAQGIYFLNVRNSEKVISQKFVVTRR